MTGQLADIVSDCIRYLSSWSNVMPLLAYFVWFTTLPRPVHLIAAFVLVCGIADAASVTLLNRGESPAWVINVQDILQYLLLSLFYHWELYTYESRTFVRVMVMVYAGIFLLYSGFVEGILEYQHYLWAVSASMLLVLCVKYYMALSRRVEKILWKDGYMWINSALFYYFALGTTIFVLSSHVFSDFTTEVGVYIWSFHNINNIIKNSALMVGIVYCGRAEYLKGPRRNFEDDYFRRKKKIFYWLKD